MLSLGIVGLSYSILIIGPVIGYYILHVYSVPTGTILPFIDPDSYEGFITNVCIQSAVGVVGFCGVIGVEIMIGIINGTIQALSDLAIFGIKKFDENIAKKNDIKRLSGEFHNVLRMTEDIISYSDVVNDVFYWKYVLQPIFTTFCTAIGVLCQYLVRNSGTNK